jgi:hypothetical protein
LISRTICSGIFGQLKHLKRVSDRHFNPSLQQALRRAPTRPGKIVGQEGYVRSPLETKRPSALRNRPTIERSRPAESKAGKVISFWVLAIGYPCGQRPDGSTIA